MKIAVFFNNKNQQFNNYNTITDIKAFVFTHVCSH